jgi:hypothetical protein
MSGVEWDDVTQFPFSDVVCSSASGRGKFVIRSSDGLLLEKGQAIHGHTVPIAHQSLD